MKDVNTNNQPKSTKHVDTDMDDVERIFQAKKNEKSQEEENARNRERQSNEAEIARREEDERAAVIDQAKKAWNARKRKVTIFTGFICAMACSSFVYILLNLVMDYHPDIHPFKFGIVCACFGALGTIVFNQVYKYIKREIYSK